jgi:hypothetical protein
MPPNRLPCRVEQVGTVVRPSVVVAGGQLRVLLERLQLLLLLLLHLVGHSLQVQYDWQRVAVDEILVPELFRSVLQRPDR